MNQFKKVHEEINSVKLAIDKYEAVKARDIKQFVEISTTFLYFIIIIIYFINNHLPIYKIIYKNAIEKLK